MAQRLPKQQKTTSEN